MQKRYVLCFSNEHIYYRPIRALTRIGLMAKSAIAVYLSNKNNKCFENSNLASIPTCNGFGVVALIDDHGNKWANIGMKRTIGNMEYWILNDRLMLVR